MLMRFGLRRGVRRGGSSSSDAPGVARISGWLSFKEKIRKSGQQHKRRCLQLACDIMPPRQRGFQLLHTDCHARSMWHCKYYLFTVTRDIIQRIKARVPPYQPFAPISNLYHRSHLYTMHFSFAIVLAVVAALASSTSAAPIDDQAICPLLCRHKGVCVICEA
ncbi:hypothetical protein EDD22DRAFT_540975 [Suillus occidentalis]|nr:hypothetical protein EDD22DRAFT_540975 [Suillus occidentalis]